MFRILIADDEATIRNGLKKLILSFDLNIDVVDTAADGEEALDYVKRFRPEIVIVDINMPFINGLDLIKEINNLSPNAKTIIISGYDEFEFAQQAIEMNVYRYLLKPINFRDFKDVLESAMNAYKERLWELNHIKKKEEEDCQSQDIQCLALNYIQQNYLSNHLTLKKMSEDLFVSDSYLTKIIKDQTGYNFTDYVNKLRLSTAQDLLSTTEHSMKDIALMTGYNSQHYFSRAFKKYTDLSPTEYREIHQKNDHIK